MSQSASMDYLKVLQHILQLMTHSSKLTQVIPKILQQAMQALDGDAAFHIIFDAPFVLHCEGIDRDTFDGALLLEQTKGLDEGLHLSQQLPAFLKDHFKAGLLAPIHIQGEYCGLFAILYRQTTIQLSEPDDDLFLNALFNLIVHLTQQEKLRDHQLKLMRNQSEFVRIVSHDLRSPLTSIKGFASMMEEIEQDEKKQHFIEKILSGVNQMASLVDNIQDAGRYDPETGFYEMERVPTDLADMIHKIVKTHLLPAEKENLTLTINVDQTVPIVNVDRNMIERSISNLVDNAIKYTPDGGKIEVALHKQGEELVIAISDTGYGISEENMKQLFQRHFRISRQEHKRVKGSGLGLFIVRSVARHHAGDAFVTSVEGQGSTFGIRIPLAGDNLIGSRPSRIN